ncbi:uncharacterized protein LOC127149687 [Cucumis melo]|uniref:Uncharacterized protein LOC127149687 n=1 Tax=Cucumis melo TaxID=3656 RepID=A0ABM3KUP8_CUCME|nr:uncharacterized protein LOC127149687 [Cucumis melo]
MAVPSEKYFPATVSCQVHKIGSLIKDKLTKDQLQMFEKTIFGPLLNVNMVFNGQLIHHFLLRQIPEDGNADGICFSVLGKNVRFTQKEFNIITGLWPTNNPLEKDCDSKRLQSLLFGSENKKVITCLEIEEIFKNFEFTNDDDAVKVALAVFIETVMVGKDKKTQFDMDILGRVDDEEAFKSFDWSTFFYTRLLNSLKTSLQGKKEAYELKKTRSSKAVSYYNIKGYVLAFQVWAYEVLSTANEHLATRNSKGLIPRILRWNCTQAPSYKMLQNNIFDNKNTVVQPKLKMSTQEKAFMESRIRGDDNMQMEEDESIGAMNNKSLEQSDSSPQREQLSPQREQSQTVAEESEMHPITKKKHFRSKKSNDKEERSHSKSYKKLKKEIKEVRKDLSTLTSIVCRMDDTITKQSLELYEMKQMLERLVQNQTENQGNDHTDQNDNEYVVQEQHTQQQPTEEQHTEHQEETQREHQEERGSDISIDGRDADLLMTIRDISDSLSHQIQKESDLPQMITTVPYPIWTQLDQAKISPDPIRLIKILMGLRPDYESVGATLLHRNPLLSLDAVVQEILFEEKRLDIVSSLSFEVALQSLIYDLLMSLLTAKIVNLMVISLLTILLLSADIVTSEVTSWKTANSPNPTLLVTQIYPSLILKLVLQSVVATATPSDIIIPSNFQLNDLHDFLKQVISSNSTALPVTSCTYWLLDSACCNYLTFDILLLSSLIPIQSLPSMLCS